jgi:hypothetical protein
VDPESKAAKQPIEVESAIPNAREMRIPQEIIAPIDVESAAHRTCQVINRMLAPHEFGDSLGQLSIEARQGCVNLRSWVQQHPNGPSFVAGSKR